MNIEKEAEGILQTLRVINRYSGEDQAAVLSMKILVSEIKRNPDVKFWEKIGEYVDSLNGLKLTTNK